MGVAQGKFLERGGTGHQIVRWARRDESLYLNAARVGYCRYLRILGTECLAEVF